MMPWNKDPDKAFPARHPREPGGLRQDILDEIADHLACAAEVEGEGQDEGNKDSAWRHALERFGDPDAVARRLWWDAMRETVMREWIQTGVMIVAAAAVVVGVVFMGVMMARVGTANEVMRDAMAQVSASNQAMMQAMDEQRRGNEALLAALSNLPGGAEPAPALELSSIELVLRRGSEEGPPAPEVEVELEGKGPNDQTMTVHATPDAEGRARFEQLYQGSYFFNFYDPVSGLGASDRITLFAGRGAGEHVIVVPDVEPRPVHLELELPTYGRDEEQLISVNVRATWNADDETRGIVWGAGGTALLGHFGTWDEPSGFRESTNWPPTGSESANPGVLEHFYIAGAVSLSEARVIERQPDGGSRTVRQSRHRRPFNDSTIEIKLTREDDTGDYYALANAEELVNLYSSTARLFRSREHVTNNAYAQLLSDASVVLEDEVVVDADGPLKQRMARYRDGLFYEPDPGEVGVHSNFYGDGGTAAVTLLKAPEPTLPSSGSGASMCLALPVKKLVKHSVERGPNAIRAPGSSTTRPTTRLRAMDDLAGNSLAAYAMRVPWDGIALPKDNPESGAGGLSLVTDEEPFWRFSSDALEKSRKVNTLFLPLPRELFHDDGAPVTGVLLKWEEATEGYYWHLEFDAANCWISVKPLSALGDTDDDQPLNDIDGRFHYDGLMPKELEPNQPRPSNLDRSNPAPVPPDAVSPKPAED